MNQAPLVGRDTEHEALSAAFATALAGTGGVLVVRGEAGVGKTRLAESVLRARHVLPSGEPAETLVLRGKATERETPLAYEAFLTALRQLRRLRGLLSLERAAPRLQPYRAALAGLLPEWRAGLPADEVAPGDRYFLFEGIAELFSELLDVQPVCLFLDDAQWMDESSVELISYLARTLVDTPFVLLLGVRDGETSAHLESLLAELRATAPFASWTLRRLDPEATTALAAAWLGVTPEQIDDRLAGRLRTETQGNPFFLQEVVAGLADAGELRREGQRVALAQPDAPMVASGVLASVQRRLGFLPPSTRAVLEAAGVIGEIVEVDLLRRALGRPLDEVLITLDELERRLFLMPDDRSPERSVRFVHPQIRQAVYRNLPLEDRLRWHREAARVLEGLPESHPARTLAAIAYHLSLAEEGERAMPYLLRAGEIATTIPSFAEAAWHITRAERHLEQLKAQGGSPSLIEWEGKLLLIRGHLGWVEGRPGESTRAFLRAWEFLRDVDDPAVTEHRTQAALFYGGALIQSGDLSAARRQLEACRPLLDAGPKDWNLHLFFQREWANLLEGEGDWEGAYEALREGLARSIATGESGQATEYAQALLSSALARGRHAEAQVLGRLIAERATGVRTSGLLHARAQAEYAIARAEGDWTTARQKAEEMLRLMTQVAHRHYMADARMALLRLQVRSDPTAAWLPLCQETEAAAAAGDVRREAALDLLRAICALEMDHREEARQIAETALARANQIPTRPPRASIVQTALCCLAEIALRQGRPEEAQSWLSAGDPGGARPDDLWAPLRLRSLAALAHALSGDAEAALSALTEVTSGLPHVGEAWLRGVILADAALAARAIGDSDEVERLAAEARGLFERCGATGRLAYLDGGEDSPPADDVGANLVFALEQEEHDERTRGEGRTQGSPLHRSSAAGGEVVRSPLVQPATAPGLRIRLLGGFEVWRGSERVTYEAWGSRKARSLFKHLALQSGRPVMMDELLEMFWPDLPLESASHALRTTLHRVRRVVEPDRAPRTPSTYLRVAEEAVHFPAEGHIWLDVAEFEMRIREAKRREVGGNSDAALQGLREALDIYTGDLLPEDRYEEWSLVPREQLQERCREALARLHRAAIETGAHDEALRLGERMLELDPCSDDGIQWVIRALDALNRRTEAVRRYEQYARRLDRELGMQPEAETRRLIEELRSRT
jgi:DNA-binding SARP family transcriptional activator